MSLDMENEQLEFKLTTKEQKEAAESIAAILNKHGSGVLYFGVDKKGDVIGQDVAEATLRQVSQTIAQSIEPRICPSIEKLTLDGHDVVRVTFAGDDTPYSCKGICRIRVSDEDQPMSQEMVRRMFIESENRRNPWDGRKSSRPLFDVDEDALRAYVARGNACKRVTFYYEGKEDALTRLGLLRNHALTNAADVLFCLSESVSLKMGVFATRDRVDILDIRQEWGTLFYLLDTAETYILNNIRRRFVIDGRREREEVPEIPREAIREALANAFCHRLYPSPPSIQIDIFADSVTIYNPGWFPEGQNPEDHLSGKDKSSDSRNPLIAETLFRSGEIESYGTGLPRIRKVCEKAGTRFEYRKEGDGTVVEFFRQEHKVLAQAQITLIAGLPDYAQNILDYIADNPSITGKELAASIGVSQRQVERVLRELKSRGVIERTGSSRYGHWTILG